MTTAKSAASQGLPASRLGRKFTLLWSASSVSAVGDGMRDAALPLLAATVSSSPNAVALVTVAGTLPWLVMSLVGGVLADRFDRRRLMWQVDLVRAVVVLGFAAWVLVASPPLVVPALLAFVLGCGETVFVNASTSALPDVVRPEQLEAANGRLEGGLIVGGHFVGPLLGSALFVVGAGYPFAVDGVSFVLAAALVAALGRSSASTPSPRRPVAADIREGVRWTWTHRGIRLLAIVAAVASMAFYLAVTMLVLLLTKTLGASPVAYGMVLASGAVGGALAGVTSGRLRNRLGLTARIGLSFFLMGASLLGLGVGSSVALAAVLYAVASFGVVTWNVQVVSLRQRVVPRRLLGRVNSCYLLLSRLGILVGAGLSGWLGSAFSVRTPAVLGGVVLLASLVVVPRLASLEAVRSRPAGLDGAAEPDPDPDPDPDPVDDPTLPR
ncbi:MFS transporter [Embleya sp. NPDC050493]|uniref:MFS transporter n=1 Tax=Embleya sp. NPDC050493 TaxID=3363989 RepID=UPI00379A7ED1